MSFQPPGVQASLPDLGEVRLQKGRTRRERKALRVFQAAPFQVHVEPKREEEIRQITHLRKLFELISEQ